MIDAIQANPNIIFAPFVIVCLGIAAIVWLAMLGGSLKFSVSACSDQSPSYLRCVITAMLMIGVNIGVFIGLYLTLGQQPWYVVSLYQLMLQTMLVAVLMQINPIAACLASLTHGFFASLGTFAIALAFILFMAPAVKGMQEREGDFLGLERETAKQTVADELTTPVSLTPGVQGNPFFE